MRGFLLTTVAAPSFAGSAKAAFVVTPTEERGSVAGTGAGSVELGLFCVSRPVRAASGFIVASDRFLGLTPSASPPVAHLTADRGPGAPLRNVVGGPRDHGAERLAG